MEDMVASIFWKNKKVLITGHTGFKGSWLSLWLQYLGADVVGISLDPATDPSIYKQAKVSNGMTSLREDIRNGEEIKKLFYRHQPEVVFHLAAQPLVRYSYKKPVETYDINVMGTLNVLEAVRLTDSVKSTILVTTDKCYHNNEWHWGYREIDPMGGRDPYSSSKGSAELLIASYRESYGLNISSVRAGNVIGGGDWSEDRIIPDIIRAFQSGKPLKVRNPQAIRPWQHVLEPLFGYLKLAEKMTLEPEIYAQAWNFGPDNNDAKSVEWIVKLMTRLWGERGASPQWVVDKSTDHPHEANYLKLDCSKAQAELNWIPRWNIETALRKVVSWHVDSLENRDMKTVTISQVKEYIKGEKY